MKDFISIADCSKEELREFLDVALRLKRQYKATRRNDPLLAGKMLAMIFEKPSLRTRVSFAVAMSHLGGAAIMLRQEEVGLGQREAVKDVARVLSGMCDGVTIRTFDHEKVQELAKWSTIPVINALSDLSHPCQAMADLMTIEEHFGRLDGKTLAFIGDGNNVARALATACGRFGRGPEECRGSALPSGLSRPGNQRRSDRRQAEPGLPAGRKPPAFPEGAAGGADEEVIHRLAYLRSIFKAARKSFGRGAINCTVEPSRFWKANFSA